MKPKYFLLLLAFLCLQSAQQLHAGIGKVINGTTITFSQDVAGGTTIKVDLNALGWSDKQEVGELTLQDGIIIAFAPNPGRYNSPIYHETYQGVYLNPNNRLTISGKVVSKVVLNCNGNTGFNHLNASADENTMTISTGSEAYRDHVVIQTIEITYGDGSYKERDHTGETFFHDKIEYEILSDIEKTCGITKQGGNKYYQYSAYVDNPQITIPSTLTYDNNEYTVTNIGLGAFSGDYEVINLPNTIRVIDDTAFSGTKLSSMILPNSVVSLGAAAFMGCTSLSSVTLPSSIKTIEHQTFDGCTSLSTITLPNSITSIEHSVFHNCTSLSSISLPNSITSIGGSAFEGCISLSNVIIPNSITSLNSNTFRGCTNLSSITLPESITNIGSGVFRDCSSLSTINLPSSVSNIGKSAFVGCEKLLSVHVNDITGWYGIDFENQSANPLYNGGNLYHNGKLVSNVVIPANIKELKNTFCGCVNVFDAVTSYADNPPAISGWEFNDYTIPLYVPKGSVLNYKAANVWRNFVIIREIDGELDAYLSVNQSNGVVMIKVDREKPYFSLQIKADDGWRIHSVTFNGNDVTAEVSTEGNYTTPAITTNSTLYVIYEKVGSGIVSLSESRMRVLAYGNNITIKDASEGERIVVYSVDGREVTAAIADNHGIVKMALPENQTYIVKGQTKTVKVRL